MLVAQSLTALTLANVRVADAPRDELTAICQRVDPPLLHEDAQLALELGGEMDLVQRPTHLAGGLAFHERVQLPTLRVYGEALELGMVGTVGGLYGTSLAILDLGCDGHQPNHESLRSENTNSSSTAPRTLDLNGGHILARQQRRRRRGALASHGRGKGCARHGVRCHARDSLWGREK
eukprot:scaffold42675_cov30-Tisochrysis_lutea.AAC.2